MFAISKLQTNQLFDRGNVPAVLCIMSAQQRVVYVPSVFSKRCLHYGMAARWFIVFSAGGCLIFNALAGVDHAVLLSPTYTCWNIDVA